jgi:hypothetical protein
MKKRTVLGLAVVTGVVGSLVAGVRYANMKKALRTGEVDGWIQGVLGDIVPYEIKSDIEVPAFIKDDKSMVYFRFSDADLMTIAMNPQSFKDTVQSIAAHELGHALDPELESIQEYVHHCVRTQDYDGFRRQVMDREQRAWDIGRQYAPNKKFFDKFNKQNMKVYAMQIGLQKGAFK